jgi:hypothetical protein
MAPYLARSRWVRVRLGSCKAKFVEGIASLVCQSIWHIDGVPPAKFYSFEIGRRGKIVKSYDDMTKAGWNITLTLGQ